MKRIGIVGCIAALAALGCTAAAQPLCGKAEIRANVEVDGSGISLADLLTAKNCSELRRAAKEVRLGNAPRPGSVRTFQSGEIREALKQLALGGTFSSTEFSSHLADASVPERIVVRRSGVRTSCAQIASFVVQALHARQTRDSFEPASEVATSQAQTAVEQPLALDCGSADPIPEGARLELTRVFWDRALGRWEFSLRCVEASDSVPFLVGQSLARQTAAATNPRGSPSNAWALARDQARPSDTPAVVTAGQAAMLFWEQGGIRAVVAVTCLERGSVGTFIRARTQNGNRILRAEVVSAGILRVAL